MNGQQAGNNSYYLSAFMLEDDVICILSTVNCQYIAEPSLIEK